MKYTVVGVYCDLEAFVDHVNAISPEWAADHIQRARGATVLCVFEGHHTDHYEPPDEHEVPRREDTP